ncbi:UbiH/UbiF/VisC/COQ6 family ubiquinone biosynthesis hydroxylase [Roseicyclus sp. F158]|uniref:UbiH/UbiF/VisC/COQ6 family ubiquinone biosynthesis hydroxylase n=1 Tax=Tropicimonas omnivorans TaxID=3075590 RepID=A0ABU3DCT0_9RHOB|nr:UbiH/UbiF/VisC/COQ6 family ubiquinone biosynthesis hydroxylase [Roseicyclus sp. F158]MDT0681373.1 UbiH/UbiF/VisC/COQ6 family ubiquinone biosynthesis hydroxylase [Roseicyclus sp. F158]
MNTDSDLIIVGGGLNGPALALAAADAGLTVTLIDREANPRQAGANPRAYALAHGSVNVLRATGVWSRTGDGQQPILGVRASDGRAGEGASPLALILDSGELEEGPFGAMVEDAVLRRALWEAIDAAEGIEVITGIEISSQTTEGTRATVTLADGRTLSSALLVGADGGRSGVASRAKISRTGWRYRQMALVATIAHERDHEGIAHQFFMPGGPLAILPLTGRRSAIVWSEAEGIAKHYASLDEPGFLAALRPRVGGFLGELSIEGARAAFPLALSLANRIVEPRLALIGEAAQSVHPIAGQGLNQGLRDVATLVEVIAEARRRGEDIGAADVLERHRRWRSFDRAALATATDAFVRLFSNDDPFLRAFRDLGMEAVTRVPGLRRAVMREAAGLSGDRPRLMQGLSA